VRGGVGQDRWARTDWWGVVLDSPDPRALAAFYSALLGWPVWRPDDGRPEDPDTASLDLGEGVGYLAFQRNDAYVRPTWPAGPGEQQMMLHLDFEVEDLAAAVEHALELGAVLLEHQPQDDVRVLLDPAGHPFCLFEQG
jgi:catechol 2,3-dioxygenase-like lactoylglutathione lyase family enzyme